MIRDRESFHRRRSNCSVNHSVSASSGSIARRSRCDTASSSSRSTSSLSPSITSAATASGSGSRAVLDANAACAAPCEVVGEAFDQEHHDDGGDSEHDTCPIGITEVPQDVPKPLEEVALHRLGEELSDQAQLEHATQQRDDTREQSQRCGVCDVLLRTSLHDRSHDRCRQHSDRTAGRDDELSRPAEQRTQDQRRRNGVQRDLCCHAGNLGIRHALGHQDRGDRQPGDDIGCQPLAVVSRDPVRNGFDSDVGIPSVAVQVVGPGDIVTPTGSRWRRGIARRRRCSGRGRRRRYRSAPNGSSR